MPMANNMSQKDIIDKYDIAVVGCGMAGLTAAIAAAESGKSTVVLEKAPEQKRGGQTQFTETMRVPIADVNHDLEIGDHVADYDSSSMYQDIMRVTQGRADPDLAQVMANSSADIFEWLTQHLSEQGFSWETTQPRPNASYSIFHSGKELVNSLVSVAEDLGVEIKYKAEARELIQQNGRAIEGVTALVSETKTEFHTNAVVIACGGFESNAEKRTRYQGGPYEEITVRGIRYNTGEAIDMALDIGAKSDGQWSGAHINIIDAGAPKVEGAPNDIHGYQFGIMLNHEGVRFLDEGEDFREDTYVKVGRNVFEQPYHEAFVIHDSNTNEYVDHVGDTKPITADSIEELVKRLDIANQQKAIETFQEYNAACEDDAEFEPWELDGNSTNGLSPDKSNWAIPLEEPPLVGYPAKAGITFTFGGLAQTPDAEVLDTYDKPIPGLYAAGNATGGLFYNNYPGGTGLTKAMVFGKIAGEEAANFVDTN